MSATLLGVEFHALCTLQELSRGIDAQTNRGEALGALDDEWLGDVNGHSLLHLQCHFGMDTLAQAWRGARARPIFRGR